MSAVERQIQLVTLLLGTRVPLPFSAIQDKMPEFYGQASVEAAKRMFERDKDDLREMGVPVAVESGDTLAEGETGYRIDPAEYYLPEIAFEEDEAAALTVLASESGEDDASIQGLRKLIYGVEGGPLSATGSVVAPGPERMGGVLAGVVDAMAGDQAIGFGYRTAAGAPSQRTIDPYGLASRDGHWYVVGADHERGDIRVFRASRFTSDVVPAGDATTTPPEGFDASAHIAGPWEQEADGVASIAVDPAIAWWVKRTMRGAHEIGARDDGWLLLEVPVTTDLVSSILRFGADAVVVSPPDLRDEVKRALEIAVRS